MPKFINTGLVAYAKAMLDYQSPYWYGTFGNVASEALYQEKKRQYKDQYEKWSKYSFESQYGMKVHDCIGLIKGYLMNPTIDERGFVTVPLQPSVYNSKYDESANMLEARAKEKGPINSIPEIPGIIVWKSGHVGVYIGNGYVIEERGHTYGTVKTKLADRPWEKWLKHPDIEYVVEPAPTPKYTSCKAEAYVLREGSSGYPVKVLQSVLNLNGYSLNVDGAFGNKTSNAVKDYKKKRKLGSTEEVNTYTWTYLLKGV